MHTKHLAMKRNCYSRSLVTTNSW